MLNEDENLLAILGPTNTGKTYTAFEKLFSFSSGIFGFPLRLLARENYDKAIKRIGLSNVALITGEETITISGLSELRPGINLICEINFSERKFINLKCRIDTNKELEYYKAGGILNYVLNEIISEAA